MALPDFIIVGAMKCGTSTLQAQLARQPGVFMSTPKEPNFFSDDSVFSKGADWYEALFAEARPGDLKGEASTHYTKLPTYPKTLGRMQALLSPPKLIYVIRDPVQRAVSHYIHEWTEGRMSGDPVAAFETHPEMVSYGCYGMQITPFVEAYGTERIHLTSLEQMKADPDAEFDKIARFLDLSESAAWQHDLAPQNVSAERVRRLPLQGLLIDNPLAQVLRRTLVPKSLRTWVRNQRKMPDRPVLPKALVNRLGAEFANDRDVLMAFFPEHPALTSSYPFLSR